MKSLTRKWHGLPIWAWAAIVAVMLFLLYRYFQGRSSGTAASTSPTAAQTDTGAASGSPAAGGSAGLPQPLDNTQPYDFFGSVPVDYSGAYLPAIDLGSYNPTEAPNNPAPTDAGTYPVYQYGSPIYPSNTFTSLAPLGGSPSSKVTAADILQPGQKPLFTPGITIGQPTGPVYSTLPNLTPLVASPKNLKSLPTDVNRATQTDVAQAAKVRQIGV